jgi:hypothetical protein
LQFWWRLSFFWGQNHLIFDFFSFANKKAKPNCAVGSRPSSPTTLHFRTGWNWRQEQNAQAAQTSSARERSIERPVHPSLFLVSHLDSHALPWDFGLRLSSTRNSWRFECDFQNSVW